MSALVGLFSVGVSMCVAVAVRHFIAGCFTVPYQGLSRVRGNSLARF